MPTPLTLAIHLSASCVTVTALDPEGHFRAHASAPLETRSPQPGWAEQAPDDWWSALREAMGELGRLIPLAAIGEVRLESALQASVFLDGDHDVIRPAILAADSRAATEAAEVGRILSQPPAWPAAAHLLWMRRHQAIAFKRVRAVLSPKAYLRLMLTGALSCEAEDATATGLFDPGAGSWSEATCDALEISLDILPPVRDDAPSAVLVNGVANLLGLRAGIPVIG